MTFQPGPDLLTLIQHSPEGLALLHATQPGDPWRIVCCNARYARLHGGTPEELTGTLLAGLTGPLAVPATESPSGREHRTGPGGQLHELEVSRSPLVLQGQPLLLESVRDLTGDAALIAQLSQRALQDALTGLGNRRAFEQDLELEMARSARHCYPVTVLMADLDGLKQINDEQGHKRGDELLRVFARQLGGQIRTSNRVYRLGGDEFAAILDHADISSFGQLLARVNTAMQQTRTLTGLASADVSIGFAAFPQEAQSQGDLVRLADERMYGQKRAHHGARPGQVRAAGQTSAAVQDMLQRTVRLTFALLSRAGEPTEQEWATLLEAAVLAVPDAQCGALFVIEGERFVLRARVGQPEQLLGSAHSPSEALAHYSGGEEAWQRGRPSILRDPSPIPASSHQHGAHLSGPGRSVLCLPVVAEQTVVAHLNIESAPGRTFGLESLDFALEFAEQLAALLASRTRQRREDNRRRELEALAVLNVALGHARTPHTVEQVLADQAVALLVTRYATYLKYDPLTDCLRSTVSSGKLAETRQVVLPRGIGLSWRAAEQRQIMRYDDARKEAVGYQHEQLSVSLSTLYAPLVSSQGSLLGVLAVGREASPFSDLDVMLVQAMISAAATSLERTGEAAAIRLARTGALHAVGLALEARDFETRGHTERVVELSRRFALTLGLDEQQTEALREGAYLHDIGKLSIPDQVLLNPVALTPEERRLMQTHAQIGHDLSLRLPSLPEAALLIRHHHEWWNGGGYPAGLGGEAIPLLARIFTLIDAYDALTSERPYKPAWTEPEAADKLRRLGGTQFDPRLLEAFLTMLGH